MCRDWVLALERAADAARDQGLKQLAGGLGVAAILSPELKAGRINTAKVRGLIDRLIALGLPTATPLLFSMLHNIVTCRGKILEELAKALLEAMEKAKALPPTTKQVASQVAIACLAKRMKNDRPKRRDKSNKIYTASEFEKNKKEFYKKLGNALALSSEFHTPLYLCLSVCLVPVLIFFFFHPLSPPSFSCPLRSLWQSLHIASTVARHILSSSNSQSSTNTSNRCHFCSATES